MDIKVLAAVFLTLFGVAVGMGQGNIQADDLTDLSKVTSRFQQNLNKLGGIGGSIADTIGGLTGGTETSSPAPNTTMRASFTADTNRTSMTFESRVDTVAINGSDITVKVAGLTADPSSASITLRNYTGKVTFDGNVTIDGSAQLMAFQGLSFNSSEPKDVVIRVEDPGRLAVEGLMREDFTFAHVDGSFSFTGTTITLSDGPATLRSFTGRFEKWSSGRYVLDGKVYRAELGEGSTRFTIGG
ncbi:MAG: hypothetical protein SV186_01075 [Candidatus Nanohaloarchaea archaeon]|nr:hypothetical protein [Candidatus Nanohaloarchaea archaeon]